METVLKEKKQNDEKKEKRVIRQICISERHRLCHKWILPQIQWV
jgi:hypothetical protein